MRKLTGAILGLVLTGGAHACKFERDFDETVAAPPDGTLVIDTSSGNVTVTGSDRTDVHIRATACVRKEWMLDSIDLLINDGDGTVKLTGVVPDPSSKEWKRKDRLDLWVEVPRTLAIDITDEEGDIEVREVGSLKLKDRGGHTTVSDVHGDVVIDEGSGKLFVDRVDGRLEIDDSTGRIIVADVKGDIHITRDTMGNIQIDRAGGNVHVDEDASGHIEVRTVAGSVVVGDDTTGDIIVENVTGDFRVNSNEKGKIEHVNVGGEIDVPAAD